MNNDDYVRLAMQSMQLFLKDKTEDISQGHIENTLINQFLNPVKVKTTRTNLTNTLGHKVKISETRKASFINDKGIYEEIEENNIRMLDDGTSTCGVVICQTCGGVVKEENIRRCKCGKTLCIRPGCGFKENGNYYCSFLHSFLDVFGL